MQCLRLRAQALGERRQGGQRGGGAGRPAPQFVVQFAQRGVELEQRERRGRNSKCRGRSSTSSTTSSP
ncbi:hypothetical protein, partial [Rubrivivax gelatinosus]|uniref:hypothetical protein n=1 Tax=Rubrivivax gelatinosus TaxID=28068 RepID=UPI001ED94900